MTDHFAAIFMVVLGFALLLSGCTAHQLDAFAANSNIMADAMEAQYAAELNSATDVPAVEKKYDPWFKAHDAWVDLWELAKQASDLAVSLDNNGGDATQLLAKAFRVAQGAITAYMTLRDIYEALRAPVSPSPLETAPVSP